MLKAVKFVEDGRSYTLSGTAEVAEMKDQAFIDHFDAYWNGQEIKSVILGTDYSQTMDREVTVSDGKLYAGRKRYPGGNPQHRHSGICQGLDRSPCGGSSYASQDRFRVRQCQ